MSELEQHHHQKEKEKEKVYFKGFQRGSKRKYAENRGLGWGSRSAASIKNLKSVLSRAQLESCATEYVNNGIVRSVTDQSAYMIQGDRSDFVIEANEEITAVATQQELANIRKTLREDPGLKELRKKVIRVNKRVQLYDRIDKLLHSTILFGRNALGIKRFKPDQDWPIYGEPQALQQLSSLRITDVQMDRDTYEFQGLVYDYGRNMGERFIPAIDLVPAFWDDNNVQDNSNYSGLSAAWTILSPAQSIDVILDEDIPESVKQVWAKFGIIFAGTSKKSLLAQMGEELLASTWFIHNQEKLTAEVHDLKNGLMDLPMMVTDLAKYICMSMSLPLFLMFEDTANFATAQQVMEVYRNGRLKRQRAWLQGIMEKYWYDPMLADHLDIEIEDVLSADWKIKATFADINFEPRKSVIEADALLFDREIMNKAEVAKDINRDDIAQRHIEEELDQALNEKDAQINEMAAEMKLLRAQLIAAANGNGNGSSSSSSAAAPEQPQGDNNGNQEDQGQQRNVIRRQAD